MPIYATGEDAGIHYYAMELIDGPSLDHVIDQWKASLDPDHATGEESNSTASGTSGSLNNLTFVASTEVNLSFS